MANTYTNLLFHIVFSTKNREPLIHNALKPELHQYLGGLIPDTKAYCSKSAAWPTTCISSSSCGPTRPFPM